MTSHDVTAALFERLFQRFNYIWFDRDKKPFNLNIVGIRDSRQKADEFNDLLYLIYRDFSTNFVSFVYKCTTDPGRYYLKNPMNPSGTAILVPGQYLSAFKLGKHQGKYEALVQAKPLKVYRDKNRDEVLDFEPSSVEEGVFGINIHRASEDRESTQVGRWSAGCQVLANPVDFAGFMHTCRQASGLFGNSFSYTLIEREKI